MVAGWWCPDLLTGPGNYLARFDASMIDAKGICRGRRTVIQAGGHIGTYPILLANYFDRVITFEPEDQNFRCLVRNIHERDVSNVFAIRGVLHGDRGGKALTISTKSTGQHRVHAGIGGTVPAFLIDDLGLDDVDLVQLDVEGCEIPALEGGRATILRSRPVVVAEENRRCVAQGYQLGDLAALLESSLGMVHRHDAGEDKVFAW